ncbi:GNAT family N-acetyltransferase [Actinosynnema sp. NPDC020468]|uniref:GNAT family N-acetyltransferase n=1 Tax=Actinosynnema sp. NPDC020468 TaxID=3154488 RepID=UPI0033F59228
MLRIDPLHPSTAAESALAGYARVLRAARAVDRPDLPGLTEEAVLGRLSGPACGAGPVLHLVAHKEDVVGVASAHFPSDVENRGVALADVRVHPGHRRAGVGTALLDAVLAAARERDRVVLEGIRVVKDGAGERWAAARGFHPVHQVVDQSLVVTEVDPALWDVRPPAGYLIRHWTGAAPDELVASLAAARSSLTDAPRGGTAYRAPTWSAGALRAQEAELAERGVERRVVVAVHEAVGEVVAFTELDVRPHRPASAVQRDTAVLARYRGLGLGRAVKAHQYRLLVAQRPGLDRVHTTTGADNAHMIGVNHQLGFTTGRDLLTVNRPV